MSVIERLPRWRCTECGRVYPAWQMSCDDDYADLLRFDVDYVPMSHLVAANEALHTIAVDISKHETEGVIWRVKLAHETSQAIDAALASPSTDQTKETT